MGKVVFSSVSLKTELAASSAVALVSFPTDLAATVDGTDVSPWQAVGTDAAAISSVVMTEDFGTDEPPKLSRC